MYNLLIAFAAGVVVTVAVRLAGLPLYAGVVPGVLVFLGVYVLLARRIMKKLQALALAAQNELKTISSPRDQAPKIAKAIKTLEQGLVLDKWQFMVAAQVHGQIGQLHYMVKDFDAAEPHLLKASRRDPMAQAMLAALYYQRKDYPRMTETFERAVKAGKKEGIVWAAYAWCLQRTKEREKAIAVLGRAVTANPSDEKLKAALSALQNDKRMKMQGWGHLWYGFHLEAPPQDFGGGRRVQFQRR
ncbi:MAG TPA: tetratricopeptide repeat protein [Myxococcaceae bacterium]|nr:tetratricopeptide repeat protein [Myxococcaceae bacterium]